jgi:fatty acid desaturase
MPDENGNIENSWAIHQMNTTKNFSRKNKWISWYVGGLNFQIEHHLFPNMPRPHLARASEIVKAYCAEHKIPYTETSLTQSYGIVVRYLNTVGLSARDPFDCPMTSQFRR